MIPPVVLAARVYGREPCARSFEEDLEAHLVGGYVVSRPDIFVMGRPVPRSAGREAILDPWRTWPAGECDCWHVWLAAGDLRALAWEAAPFPLPYLSYERANRFRCARFESLLGRVNNSNQSSWSH